MTRTICMNKEIDLKQSTSTMAIVVASGAKVTCFVTVLFMLAHWSPAITVITTKSEKFFRKKRLPRSCTITFFNCCSCLVFVQRECFPEKLQSPPQNNASNKSCPKKRHNFGKPAFMSNKNRSKGNSAPPGNSDFFPCPPPKNPRPVLEIHLDINRTVALVRRGLGKVLWGKTWKNCVM